MLLIGLFRIISFDPAKLDSIHAMVRTDDDSLNQIPGMNCRIWVARVCERLKDAGFMAFESWQDVETETMGFANAHKASSGRNDQPRPLGFSKACGLVE